MLASCGGRHFLLIFEMLAHESLANGILSHGYTHVRRGERHPRASKREGEYTSQRMWLVLPAAACFLWRSSKPPLHLAGDTLALCVFCMPLISPKVRSPLYIMSYSIAPRWCHFYVILHGSNTCAHNKVATATRSVKREPDSSQPDTDRTTQM